MKPTWSMQSLDAEIVRHIFEHLGVKDRGRLAQVCRAWNAIADEPNIWVGEEAQVRLKDSTFTELLAGVGRRQIRKLKVTTMHNPVFHLPRLLRALPEAKSLVLDHCDNLTDDVILVTFTEPQWTLLTTLNLSYCYLITDVAVSYVTRQMPNLEHLRLNYCKRITDVSAAHIAANLSKLKTLQMKRTKLSNTGLRLLAGLDAQGVASGAAAVGSLESLSLESHGEVGDDGLIYLSLGMHNLVALDVRKCRTLTDTGIGHIARIPTLRKLVCFGCKQLTPLTLQKLSTRPFPMEFLDVSYCYNIASDGLLSIAAGPSLLGLTTLRIIGVSIQNQGLSYVAKNLTRLAFLDISACRKITKDGIRALATHLPCLRVLVMRCTTALKDGTLRHLGRMPSLETVNLKGCQEITGRGPSFIAGGDFQPSFFELDVSFTGIGYPGVRCITEAFPGLRYLSLNGCLITDRAVALVARRMRYLQTLKLQRCKMITNKSLKFIATHLKDLRLIDVNGNPHVTKAAKKKLAVALPHLKFL